MGEGDGCHPSVRWLARSHSRIGTEHAARGALVPEARRTPASHLGSLRDPTRPCVLEEARVTPRNPWWAVRDSNPGPSG